ncbi:MAG: hypothetical protein A2033_06450 [Bacteroidetes bacterium GWA2_31_9]|nr:MAG: hypothetical protein A2033_06450 [Bacteroidetes bacterium GWA2_31_9]
MNMFRLLLLLLVSFFILESCKKEEPTPEDENPIIKNTPADFTLNWEKAWGTAYEDDFSGAVTDNAGNMYFVGTSQPDGYAANIFITKMNLTNQSVVWSKSYDLGDRDYQPSPSENGHSQGGGGSRCIAIDATGNIYIAGTTKQGFNDVFIAKINSSGNMLWQKVWVADNSGLSKSSAKAYAIDVQNDKVFITGSTGAGIATEEAMIFLLVIDANSGNIDPLTVLGIDPSSGYNDRGYTIKATANGDVYVAGWEGHYNSGFLMKFSSNGSTLDWFERLDIGYASRITDIDIDASGNIYLAADLRGVSTYLGIVKTDSEGNVIWAKQMQGESNDRNNVSCLRIINGNIYIGGRGAYTDYDVSQFGDGCYYKMDANGNILKLYNYFTGGESGNRCGERMEAILSYNGSLIIAGETWPEASKIDGKWYIPQGIVSNLEVTATKVANPSLISDDGIEISLTATESSLSSATYNPSEGSKGSSDVIIFSINE